MPNGGGSMSLFENTRGGRELEAAEQSYARLKAELLAARGEKERFVGPCASCHFHKTFSGIIGLVSDCHHPLAGSFVFDRQNGTVVFAPHPIHSGLSFTLSRGIPAVCGPDRVLWEPHRPRWRRWYYAALAWLRLV